MKKISFFLLIVVSIFGCDDAETPSKKLSIEDLVNEISIKEDYLVFKDEEHFAKTISMISQKEELLEFKLISTKFLNFESNFVAFNKIEEKDFEEMIKSGINKKFENVLFLSNPEGEESAFVRNISYAPLALLVNSKGKVMIGKDLHTFKSDKVLVEKLDNYGKSLKTEEYPVIRKTKEVFSKSLKPSAEIKSCDQYRYSGNERRLCGIINFDYYYSPGISGRIYTTFTTQHQTRTLGFIWYTSVISQISLTGTVYVEYNPNSINISNQNVSSVSYYVPSYCVPAGNGTYCVGVVTGSSTTHKGMGLDGNWKQVNV
jgi:hypothetical protein